MKEIKKKGNENKTKKYIIFLAVTILVISGIIFYQFQPSLESAGFNLKKIPPDVKDSIDKQTSKTNISTSLRVPILLYHYVEYVQDKKDTMRQSLDINPNVFEKQVKTLKEAGYNFLTASELGEALDGKIALPKNPILLTFDDGHWDLDTVVLPILKKYNAKATAYIVSGFLGGSDSLNKNQLQDVINSGLVEIGAHTTHHVSLKGKLPPVVTYEVSKSKASLEQTYHIHVVSFAYPNGSFDNQAIKIVKEAGFTTAVSTIPGIMQNQQNRFFLYRIRPGYRTGQQLLIYLQHNTFKMY